MGSLLVGEAHTTNVEHKVVTCLGKGGALIPDTVRLVLTKYSFDLLGVVQPHNFYGKGVEQKAPPSFIPD